MVAASSLSQQLVTEVVVKDSASAVADRISQSMDKMGNAVDQSNQKVAGSTRTLENYARGFERLKQASDPAYATATRLADAQAKLNTYVGAGVATSEEAASVMS